MDLNSYTTLGLVGGTIAAAWNQVRAVWSWLAGLVIRSIEVQNEAGEAAMFYLNNQFKLYMPGNWICGGMIRWVKPVQRTLRVGVIKPGVGGLLYRKGWRFLLLQQVPMQANGGFPAVRLIFPRIMFQDQRLLVAALDFFNDRLNHQETHAQRRYCVRRIYGCRRPDPNAYGYVPSATNSPPKDNLDPTAETFRYLKWRREDLGYNADIRTFDDLALSEDTLCADREVRFWIENEHWFKDRSVPWRRGILAHGEPGNGKTSLARGWAQKYDLPIWVFDLSSLSNQEMQEKWQLMQSDAPAMALIEDIDGVFHGRENVTKEKSLSFDCLLNCLDGVDRADGILLFITTNDISKVDAAIVNRPGRIDRVLEMLPPDADGRMKIARRILRDWPDLWGELVAGGHGLSGSAFQDSCAQKAMQLFWSEKMRSAA